MSAYRQIINLPLNWHLGCFIPGSTLTSVFNMVSPDNISTQRHIIGPRLFDFAPPDSLSLATGVMGSHCSGLKLPSLLH